MSTKNSVIHAPDLEFAPGLKLDLSFPPDGQQRAGVVVWLHGGAWRVGDRTLAPDLGRYFAERGLIMASIDYRLSGDAVFPAQLQDVQAAVRWLVADPLGLGTAGHPIALWGSSAGGHLAALCGVTAAESMNIVAVVDGYGPSDLLATDQDVPPTRGLLGAAPADAAELAREASPAHRVHAAAPSILILHGTGDTLVPASQSVALYEAYERAGADAVLYLIDGFGHGFFNPAGGDELPGLPLDSGRLESEPNAPATVRATRQERLAKLPASASFDLVYRFIAAECASASARPPFTKE
ncbi:alpha/beta hydrolase [Lysinibacter cavernae]|uniref:Acetyl esterase/lipase n=1 Tax=Lysinibacter cavernae TaxID=1640652 RepID=A0A7X5R2G8_9MICO|nr:alpha/beta hydrolase [Lysinibacter cavernae]NIH54391.1 acetyl esterase/lipase [Lysinibacter cavernae]